MISQPPDRKSWGVFVRIHLLPYGFAMLVGIILFYATLLLTTDKLYDSDFRVFYSSGYLLRTNPTQLYDRSAQEQTQLRFFPKPDKEPVHTTLSFVNPPFLALAYAPFTLVPPLLAHRLWMVVALILLAYTLFQIHTLFRLSQLSLTRQLGFILFCLSFAPVYVGLAMGQASFLGLLFFSLGTTLITSRPLVSGILFGLLFYKPQLALLTWLAVARRPRLVLGILLSVIGMVGVSVALGSNLLSFLQFLTSYALRTDLEHTKGTMISWQGFWTQAQILWGETLPVLWLTLASSVVTLVGIMVILQKKSSSPLHDRLACITPLLLLTGFHVHGHDAIFLLFPLSYLTAQKSLAHTLLLIWTWWCFFFSYFSPFFPYPFFFAPHLTLVLLAIACVRQKDRI